MIIFLTNVAPIRFLMTSELLFLEIPPFLLVKKLDGFGKPMKFGRGKFAFLAVFGFLRERIESSFLILTIETNLVYDMLYQEVFLVLRELEGIFDD